MEEEMFIWLLLFIVLGLMLFLGLLFIKYTALLKKVATQEFDHYQILQRQEEMQKFSQELIKQIEYEVAQKLIGNKTYDYLFESSFNGILIVQDDDLKIIRTNQAARMLFGRDVIATNILELFSPEEDKQYVLKKINQVLHDKNRRGFKIVLHVHQKTIPVVVSIHLFEFARKSSLYVTLTDISEIVRLEAELDCERVIVTQKSKMEAMGKMIGNIVHQWKQPLNSLYLICQNLRELHAFDELDKKNFEKYLKMMMGQIKFMSKTIDNFMNFYVPITKQEPFCLCSAIKEVLDLFYQSIDEQIHIDFFDYQKESFVLGLKSEFQQVIIVLLDNAIDAILQNLKAGHIQKGKVEIFCQKSQEEEDFYRVIIRDNGGGIDPLMASQVFNLHYSTKENGSGIGLTIVMMILKKIGAKISFANCNGGVEFRVDLPCYQEPIQM